MVAIPEHRENTGRPQAYLQKYQAWLDETMSEFGEYAPLYHGLDITGSGWSEREAYERCNRIRDYIINSMDERRPGRVRERPAMRMEEPPGNRHLHLMLSVEGNTSVVYDMSNGSIYAIMSRDAGGRSFSYYGPERGLTM
ncbi:MAG: hypothetical protein HYW27_04685, partial [Candidatus Aenigmarchaeota archaeon]|nr:hypothetical protein [Candidatus Aenigmarchaeota archaeon]